MEELQAERVITSAGTAIETMRDAYDVEVREFLAEKRVLAVILKSCVKEFQNCSLTEIADACIEGMPQVHETGVACYELNERFLAGEANRAAETATHYDLLSVLVLGLGNPNKAEKCSVLRMLGTALSTQIDQKTKKQVLSEEFHIPMTRRIERKVERMCNLSQGIWEEGMQKGRKQGREEGETLLARLICRLIADCRMDDVELATADKDARLRLYREYKIM